MPKPKLPAYASPSDASLAEQLRAAIRTRGLTAYGLAKHTQIDHRVIARFLEGSRDIYLATADKLAAALGLRLAEPVRKTSAKPPTPRPQPMPVILEDDVGPE